MPNIIYGNINRRWDILPNLDPDINYDYPNGLDFSPGSELSNRILDLILERAQASAQTVSSRFDAWQEMDKSLTAYKITDNDEKIVKSNDRRKPVSIVFPYSYAILETMLSYMMSAFFRDPVFQYEGTGPNDIVGAILLEKIIDLHVNKFKTMLNLHTMFRDAFVYGAGYVAPIWKKDPSGFEGNALINLDPYRVLPDVNVAADKLQDGEYFAWSSDENYMNLLAEEFDSNGTMFNVRYLERFQHRGTSIYQTDNSGRALKSGVTTYNDRFNQPITEIHTYIKIIPSDHGLGDSNRPEIWYFRVAGDAIVLSARPANFAHGKFPISCIVPDYDGYSISPISRIEMLSGMQELLDWMLNSHVANVRKAINDTLIYDPSLINTKDLKDPKPGGLIRMRRNAFGSGRIRDAIHQLQVNDVTRGNVADSGWIINSMQTLMGTDSSTMGMLRQGGPERLTKAEFQGTAVGKISRLERVAKIIGMQGIQDIGEFFASHTQQVMKKSHYVKVAGKWLPLLLEEFGPNIQRGRLEVSPKDIDINYDIIVRDGSLPNGNYSEVWLRMFDSLTSQPELANHFDIVKIFKHIARNAGAKNVNSFVRQGGGVQPRALPNNQVQNLAQRGNITPINQVA